MPGQWQGILPGKDNGEPGVMTFLPGSSFLCDMLAGHYFFVRIRMFRIQEFSELYPVLSWPILKILIQMNRQRNAPPLRYSSVLFERRC
jgi:hypothetical protein